MNFLYRSFFIALSGISFFAFPTVNIQQIYAAEEKEEGEISETEEEKTRRQENFEIKHRRVEDPEEMYSRVEKEVEREKDIKNAEVAFKDFLEDPFNNSGKVIFKIEKAHFAIQKIPHARGGYFVGDSIHDVIDKLRDSHCKVTNVGPDVLRENTRALINCNKAVGYDVSHRGEDLGTTQNILMIFRKDQDQKEKFFIVNMYPRHNLT